MRLLLILLCIFVLMLQFMVAGTSAHQIREIETIEIDVSPLQSYKVGTTKHVTIDSESTIVPLQYIPQYYPDQIIYGTFEFSNVILENTGMEAYRTVLHQTIFVDWVRNPIDNTSEELELGTRTQELSSSALHDGKLHFAYNMANLDDLSWSPYIVVDMVKNYLESSETRKEREYRIEHTIEFIRGTKQNGHFEMEYSLERYNSKDIPISYFHYEQKMNTTSIPQSFYIDGSSPQGTSETVYLLLPDEMVPMYFQPSEYHEMNLTKIPLTIDLKLNLANDNNKFLRALQVSNDFYHASLEKKNDKSEEFKLIIQVTDTPLIPIKIKAIGYVGEIQVEAKLKLRSLFFDIGLYAKNEYFFSPNQYILLITVFSTIVTYKLVDYVEYRIYQERLSNLDSSLLEEEYNR